MGHGHRLAAWPCPVMFRCFKFSVILSCFYYQPPFVSFILCLKSNSTYHCCVGLRYVHTPPGFFYFVRRTARPSTTAGRPVATELWWFTHKPGNGVVLHPRLVSPGFPVLAWLRARSAGVRRFYLPAVTPHLTPTLHPPLDYAHGIADYAVGMGGKRLIMQSII